jgi:hypothetical protein
MRLSHQLLSLSAALGLTFLIGPYGDATFQLDDPDLPPAEFSVETRGPVHEAFAQPNEGKPELSIAIGQQPPPPLPEQPPEQRPDDPNMEWIPGYWAWDVDRNDFIWVSGTFRDPPPGRRWIPGHWANTSEGWRWASGFWADENQSDLRYTPEPPAPLEDGPTVPPPDDNSTYIPGCWLYNDGEQRFAWRPGFWAPFRAGLIWTNPQYYWTPGGYAFANGYWDYPLDNRGILYAPAYFPTPLWTNPGWFYRPRFIVSLGAFFNSGFYRPGFNHFYFGNYYGNNYARLGYRPWWGATHNPAFRYYAWQNRNNPQFVAQQQQLFNNRMAGKTPRPPATFAQQQALVRAKGTQAQAVVTPAARFTPPTGKLVPNTQLAAQNLQIRQARELSKLRGNAERPPVKTTAPAVGKGATPALASVKLPPAPPRIRKDGAPASALDQKSGPRNTGAGFKKGQSVNSAIQADKAQPGRPAPGPRPFVASPGPKVGNPPKNANPAPAAAKQLQPGGPTPGPRPSVANPGPKVSNPPKAANPAPAAKQLNPGGPTPGPRPFVAKPGPKVSNPPKAVNPAPAAAKQLQPGGTTPGPRPFVANPGPKVSNPPKAANPAPAAKQLNPDGPTPGPRPFVAKPGPTISNRPKAPNPAPATAKQLPPGGPRPFTAPPGPSRNVGPKNKEPSPVVNQPRPSVAPVKPSVPRPNPAVSTPRPTFRPPPAPAPRIPPSAPPAIRTAPPAPSRNFSAPPANSRPSVSPNGPRPGGGGGTRPGGGGKR